MTANTLPIQAKKRANLDKKIMNIKMDQESLAVPRNLKLTLENNAFNRLSSEKNLSIPSPYTSNESRKIKDTPSKSPEASSGSWGSFDYNEDTSTDSDISPRDKLSENPIQSIMEELIISKTKHIAPLQKRLNNLEIHLNRLPSKDQVKVRQQIDELKEEFAKLPDLIQDKKNSLLVSKTHLDEITAGITAYISDTTHTILDHMEAIEDLYGSELLGNLIKNENSAILVVIESLVKTKFKAQPDLTHIQLSRKSLALARSYLISADGKIYRYLHKTGKDMGTGIRTPREKSLIGVGGIKKANKLLDQEGNIYVRSTFLSTTKEEVRTASIQAAKKFSCYPELCCGHYIEWIDLEEHKKGAFLAPLMIQDLSQLVLENVSKVILSKQSKLKAFIQIAKGLNIVHKEGWAHFDIKPANIFVNYDEKHPSEIEAKLADFDFAKTVKDHENVGRIGSVVYMAPEIEKQTCVGLQAAMKADIFSLGLSFLELLQGKYRDTLTTQFTYEEIIKVGFPKPNDQKSLEFLIWEMINPEHPEQRPSIEQVINRLESIYQIEFPQ